MRIISGLLKGRQFATPHGHVTHPMGDKVKGALFNMLGDITGLTVLDPYGGSGALSFEAISRGAKYVEIIELDKNAQRTVAENIGSLGIADRIKLTPGNCIRWSQRYPEKMFDLVLADPPYDSVLIGTIEKLARHVKNGGILVLSWPKHVEVTDMDGFEIIKSSLYANARLVFYRRIT